MDALHALISGRVVHAKPDMSSLVLHAQLVMTLTVVPVLMIKQEHVQSVKKAGS